MSCRVRVSQDRNIMPLTACKTERGECTHEFSEPQGHLALENARQSMLGEGPAVLFLRIGGLMGLLGADSEFSALLTANDAFFADSRVSDVSSNQLSENWTAP